MFHATELLGQRRAFIPDRSLPVSDPDVASTHPSAWLLLFFGLHSKLGLKSEREVYTDRMSQELIAIIGAAIDLAAIIHRSDHSWLA